ncbi:MAG: nucleotidyl transferase AbiEii/AbiGii toxin family protein [Patescibacteria group bacterium]
MYQETLTKNTQSVLKILAASGIAKDFYLAGGTALALYLGHRFSVDLDWFAPKFSLSASFRQKLEKLGELEIDSESENTFNGALNGVRVSFFEYPYRLIAPTKLFQKNVYLAGIPDIAAMKIEAVSRRGSYKDFIDLYFLLEDYSLAELLGFVRKKFASLNYNEAHLLKALTYFKDAGTTAMPKLIKPVSWQEITKTINSKVKIYLNQEINK